MGALINNHAGYGVGSGKVDGFGLPIYEVPKQKNSMDCHMHESREAVLEPLTYPFPMGGAAMFTVTNGYSTDVNLPTANFYDVSKEDIPVGWKRGLWVIAPALGICGVSFMVRNPVPGWVLKYSIETPDCTQVLDSWEVDAGANCGRNQVVEFDTMITDGLAVMFVEVVARPDEIDGCCPLTVAARAVIKDYSHESYMDMCINCCSGTSGCKDCECTEEYNSFRPAGLI